MPSKGLKELIDGARQRHLDLGSHSLMQSREGCIGTCPHFFTDLGEVHVVVFFLVRPSVLAPLVAEEVDSPLRPAPKTRLVDQPSAVNRARLQGFRKHLLTGQVKSHITLLGQFQLQCTQPVLLQPAKHGIQHVARFFDHILLKTGLELLQPGVQARLDALGRLAEDAGHGCFDFRQKCLGGFLVSPKLDDWIARIEV